MNLQDFLAFRTWHVRRSLLLQEASPILCNSMLKLKMKDVETQHKFSSFFLSDQATLSQE